MSRLSPNPHDLPDLTGNAGGGASRPDDRPAAGQHRGVTIYLVIVLAGVLATLAAGTGVDQAFFDWLAGL